MTQPTSYQFETDDERLGVLATEHGRDVLSYFQHSPSDTASLQELAANVSERPDSEHDAIRIRLHHSTLPKLDATGVVEYDTATNTVQYDGDDELERLLAAIADH